MLVIPAQAGIQLFFFLPSFPRKRESILTLLSSAKLRLALRASRLLFGIAQKVTKKARPLTRRSDSHRANRTSLRFSSSRGRSDSTVPVLLRDRGDPSPRPFGLIPRSLRCSAPRTAPVVHESVHPCTASLRSFAPRQACRKSKKRERLLLRQDAARMGPLWRGEGVEEKPEGWRARCAPVRCMYMDVHSANPGAPSRTRRAGCPEGAPPGCVSFGDFSLDKQRKVTRSPGGRVEALPSRNNRAKELDSGFRRNDEQIEESFRLKPEPRVSAIVTSGPCH